MTLKETSYVAQNSHGIEAEGSDEEEEEKKEELMTQREKVCQV